LREEEMSKQKTWERHMRAYERSGLSIREYCRKHDLNFNTFGYWRHKLNNSTNEPQFVEVGNQAEAPLELVLPSGVIVRVPGGF
jgi:transposase-like protein